MSESDHLTDDLLLIRFQEGDESEQAGKRP